MIGRPSTFTPELADEICERISEGASLREICRNSDMPSKATVFRWLAQHETFRNQYARARSEQADVYADAITAIADEAPVYVQDEKSARVDTGWVAWQRNRIDARKWVASKLAPKKYGESQNLNVTGSLDVRSVFAGINAAHEARTQPRADSDPSLA